MGAKKGGQNSMCCRRAKKNRGQKSICGHKKGGQCSMSHWKIGVKILCVVLKSLKILCSKSWEGQNYMKAKIWGSKFYFFLVEPLVKILCSLKRGGQNFIFFPSALKKGGQNRGAYQPTSLKGCPPPPGVDDVKIYCWYFENVFSKELLW